MSKKLQTMIALCSVALGGGFLWILAEQPPNEAKSTRTVNPATKAAGTPSSGHLSELPQAVSGKISAEAPPNAQPEVSSPTTVSKTAEPAPATTGRPPKPSSALQMAAEAEMLMQEAISQMDLSTEETRMVSAAKMRTAQRAKKAAGEARAEEIGFKPAPGEIVSGISPAGVPLIRIDHNKNAAISSNVTAALARPEYASLTGSGMLVGCWEVSMLRTTHQEYASRLTVKQVDPDLTQNGDHATHVSGTLVGAGIDPLLKGMAPAASLWFWNAAEDLAEMTEFGAKFGSDALNNTKLTLSNHSYGFGFGWHLPLGTSTWLYYGPANTTQDPSFGFYGSTSQAIDQLSIQAPYYLTVQSAGNERGAGPGVGSSVILVATGQTVAYDPNLHPERDGGSNGYDTLGSDKTYKNGLVVGAASDAVAGNNRSLTGVSIASFSSCGPTDDGRIKPDCVGNGLDLLSASSSSDTATVFKSGTSMSGPNVCGSALLLQQYSKAQFGKMLLNYELKSLLLHTCDDVGNPGPDYRFGWGYMNTEAALDRLRDEKNNPGAVVMETNFLASYKPTWSKQFTGNGTQLKVTLCWNDPAATPLATNALNNRTKRLIHDLDVRVENSLGQTMDLPWRLDPDNPGNNATKGDNTVDNVEQIMIPSAPPGTYTVKVSHKGTLTTLQPFCVVISGQFLTPPTSPILYASGGDVDLHLVENTRGPAGSIVVQNAGAGTLNYSVSSSATWLQPTVTSGTSTGEVDRIHFNLETQNLTQGNYTGTITVTPTSPVGLPAKTMTVKLEMLNGQPLEHGFSDTYLDWTAGGTADQMQGGHSWDYALVSRTGRIDQNQTATLQTTVPGPGVFSLKREISGGADNLLEVLVNGSVIRSETGPKPLEILEVPISGTGAKVIQIRFTKTSGVPDFKDGLILHNPNVYYRIPDLPSSFPTVYGEGGDVVVSIPFTGHVTDIDVSVAGFTESAYAPQSNNPHDTFQTLLDWENVPVGTHNVTLTVTGHGGVTDSLTFQVVMLSTTGFSGPDHPKAKSSYENGIPWVTVASPNHDGVDSAQSGTISHNQKTTCMVYVDGPATVSFWAKTSSEPTYDKLNVYVSDATTPAISISGEQDWALRTVFVPLIPSVPYGASKSYVRFSYEKDVSLSSGSDKAWIDQISITPAPHIAPDGTMVSKTPEFFGGQVGKPLQYYFNIVHGSVTSIIADQLPPGLSINLAQRRVEGTPTAPVASMTSLFTISGPGGSLQWAVDWEIASNLSLEAGLGAVGLDLRPCPCFGIIFTTSQPWRITPGPCGHHRWARAKARP
jgi:hypothetical protein